MIPVATGQLLYLKNQLEKLTNGTKFMHYTSQGNMVLFI